MNLQHVLTEKIRQAMAAAELPYHFDPQVRPATKPLFGDYQANGIMAVAKQLGVAPRQLATQVVAQLDLTDIAQWVDIAGPGFINIALAPHWLARQADSALADPKLNVTPALQQIIIVDYSGPNVAKEMAVHHIRSTVIGDAMVRTLQRLGHKVIKANHLGDWGTQFGMLIAYLEILEQQGAADTPLALSELETFYRNAKHCFDNDPAFATCARHCVVQLQQGDPTCLAQWDKLVAITMTQNQAIYQRLNVLLTPEDTMGESLYNPMLPMIVNDLKTKGIAVESDGALVVFLDQLNNKQGDPMGVIIQKSDGGFLYSTTDIACAKYRCDTFKPDRILYYVDSRQQQHLTHAWAIARRAGYVPAQTTLEHHAFGMMLGSDGKPFKTRSGGTVKLAELLDEALQRADQLISAKSPHLSPEQHQQVVNAVAMGAIKYADLSKNRTTDYCFDWDNMLSLEGNTAPYLQYAYSRICAIFRRADLHFTELPGRIDLAEAIEKNLALKLLQFEETLYQVARDGMPHLMCHYLYELAGVFSTFYESCPILNNPEQHIRTSRLRLAALTAKTLQQGLETLGIQTVEQM